MFTVREYKGYQIKAEETGAVVKIHIFQGDKDLVSHEGNSLETLEEQARDLIDCLYKGYVIKIVAIRHTHDNIFYHTSIYKNRKLVIDLPIYEADKKTALKTTYDYIDENL